MHHTTTPPAIAVLFTAGEEHKSGVTYTDADLEKMAARNPISMYTERDRHGRLQLKVRA